MPPSAPAISCIDLKRPAGSSDRQRSITASSCGGTPSTNAEAGTGFSFDGGRPTIISNSTQPSE